MGQCFLYGNGSGGGLRLRIFGGASAPSSPKDNDIWVKTNTAIETWELSDKTLPISWDMPSGWVYIKGDFAGAYDYRETTGLALDVPGNHDCTMYARLTSCVQYDGSAWASKDAYIYHDGWHQFSCVWNGELFDNGNQYTQKTGGWVGNNYTEIGTTLKLKVSNSRSIVSTVNAIDLSGYSTLHCIADLHLGKVGVSSTKDLTAVEPAWTASTDLQAQEVTVDISSLTTGYIQLFAGASWTATVNATKVWLT